MSDTRKLWTKQEEAELLNLFETLSENELTKKFDREYTAIKRKFFRLKKSIPTKIEITENNDEDGEESSHIPDSIKKKERITQDAQKVCRALKSGYDPKTNCYLLACSGRFHVISKDAKLRSISFKSIAEFASHLFSTNKIVYVEDRAMINYYIRSMSMSIIVFDPKNPTVYQTLDNGLVVFNSFVETEYLKLSRLTPKQNRHKHLSEREFQKKFPRTYLLLNNLCEGNYEYSKIFMNNLATIAHRREKIGTIQLFKGGAGAGKGQTVTQIMEPFFGKDQVVMTDSSRMSGNFNASIEKAFIVILDETKNDADQMNDLAEKLKSISTMSDILIEKKNIDAVKQETYFTFFLFSNSNKAAKIDIDDRRYYIFFTIDAIQTVAKKIMNEDMTTFWANMKELESDSFLKYLATLDYDYELARKASLLNATKIRMVIGTNKRYEMFFKILQSKNVEFLRFLHDELKSSNEERVIHNDMCDASTLHIKKLEIIENRMIEQFFTQALKGRVKRELGIIIFDLFMNDSKNWYRAKITKTLNEGFDSVRVHGYNYFRTSSVEANCTLDDIIKLQDTQLSIEEQEKIMLIEGEFLMNDDEF
ncbi:MAG: DUF5906 domain-containing protein [Sulfuricurvum sp.]|nr:DUF5906 domain-containing protein [Sulfuricurvum sp.]